MKKSGALYSFLPAFVLLLPLLLGLFSHAFFPEGLSSDGRHYVDMARGRSTIAPFGYRILVPTLVGLLPVPPRVGFSVLAYVGGYISMYLLFHLLRHLDIPDQPALAAALLFGLSFPLFFYLRKIGRIDAPAHAFLVGGLLLIYGRRFVWSSILIALGVLVKETILILLPLLAYHRFRVVNGSLWVRATEILLVIALPIAVFLVIRSTVVVMPGGAFDRSGVDGLLQLMDHVWTYAVEDYGIVLRLGRVVLRSYGFLWATAAVGLLYMQRYRLDMVYLLATGIGLCVVATDWSRMLATPFPAVFVPTGVFFAVVWSLPDRRKAVTVLLLLGATQGFLSMVGYEALSAAGKVALVGAIVSVTLAGCIYTWFLYRRAHRRISLGTQPVG